MPFAILSVIIDMCDEFSEKLPFRYNFFLLKLWEAYFDLYVKWLLKTGVGLSNFALEKAVGLYFASSMIHLELN